MTYPRSIEEFKAVLQGGGVRPTMFQVELTFPTGVSADNNLLTNDGTFLIKATQLPASTVGVIDVPFRGRKLKVSGDREFADWNINVINDVSFGLRKGLEEWSELIQNHNYALGATELNDYFASAIVRQLDRDGDGKVGLHEPCAPHPTFYPTFTPNFYPTSTLLSTTLLSTLPSTVQAELLEPAERREISAAKRGDAANAAQVAPRTAHVHACMRACA